MREFLNRHIKFLLVLLGVFVAMLVVLRIAEFLSVKAAVLLVVSFVFFVAAIAFAKAFSKPKIMTFLLAGSLLAGQTTCYAPENDPPPGPGDPQESWVGIVLGIIVVVGGAYLIYKLWQFINRVLPPAPVPPPQPPPANTNNPPVALASLPLAVLEMKDEVSAWDITMWTSNNPAFNGPDGKPYTKFFQFTVLSGSTPSALSKDCAVIGWASDTHILTVMEGVATNVSRFGADLHFAGDNRKGDLADPPMRFYSTQQ